jgi:dTDP-glucose pyrophosphorylase
MKRESFSPAEPEAGSLPAHRDREKQLPPIYDRPMIHCPIQMWMDAGIEGIQ